jgi:hypothetical protein
MRICSTFSQGLALSLLNPCWLCFLLLGTAVEAADVADVLAECKVISDQNARLACYDRATETAKPSAPAAAKSAIPAGATKSTIPANAGKTETLKKQSAEPAPAAPQDNVAAFGMDGKKDEAKVLNAEDGQQELADTIKTIKLVQPEIREITLSSGQVWRQMHSQVYRLLPGDDVRIKPSGWGESYRLTVERLNGFIQVQRVR